jgi:transcriptional regulator with XRE-family HTH domain
MYKLDRCRCVPCTDAAANAERRRRLDAHIGAAPRRVDAGPVRAHIAELQAQGLGYRRVAALAGLSASTIAKIINRDPSRADGAPQLRVAPETAQRILAVRASLDVVSDGAVVDGTGTLRRLRALHARGWSRRGLAARLGVEHNALAHIERTGTASGRLARAVRDLYEELWDQAPPSATPRERAAVTRTLRWAESHRWAPPASWDDDRIDDPAARPLGVRADAWEVAA